MSKIPSENLNLNSNSKDIPLNSIITSSKNQRKDSSDSSNSDSYISNMNEEIKIFMENNDNNESFSSNSENGSQPKKADIDYLLDTKFWNSDKNYINEPKLNKEQKIPELKNSKKENEKNGKNIGDESYKQSTQGNEDEETRVEHLYNISSTESNNSPLNSFNNNESSENENNYEKISKKSSKEDKNINMININNKNMNNLQIKDDKLKIDNNKNNTNIKDKNNLIGTNILLNGSNFSNNINNYKNNFSESKFIFPYEPINYMTNLGPNNFFPNPYLAQNLGNYNPNFNYMPPLNDKNNIISINNFNNNNNKIRKNSEPISINNNINININIQNNNNNNFINQIITDNNKKSNSNNNKDINNSISPKLNINNSFNNQKNTNNITQPQTQPNEKLKNSISMTNIKDYSNKKTKINNNISSKEQNNSKSTNTNKNQQNSDKKNNINNNNINNNNKNIKGEKQILNLEDIALGKDKRTTIMIRNIPIKYTDEMLDETFKDFYGKYDCLYMPYDHEKKGNKGYAFINFVNPLHILLFYDKFNGQKWEYFESPKICELNMAHFQGINEIQKHAKNFKELKKACYNKVNDKIIIPSKYLLKMKKRYPKMKINENKKKNVFELLSLD